MSSERLKIGAIVQARLGSTRLPEKVLHAVHGKPLLQYTLESLRQIARLDQIVVATSTDPGDDRLAEWCRQFDVDCIRGPLEDVAGRFTHALHQFPCNAFVRVNGDSPLLDYRLIERGIELFESTGCDIATNVFPKTFPNGQSVEVIRSETFLAACPQFETAADREHVTPYFYAHRDRFRIENFKKNTPCRDLEFAVDTPQHLRELEAMLAAMDRPHWEYDVDELIALHRSHCHPAPGTGSRSAEEVKPCRG